MRYLFRLNRTNFKSRIIKFQIEPRQLSPRSSRSLSNVETKEESGNSLLNIKSSLPNNSLSF